VTTPDTSTSPLVLASVNVNGLRAAVRNGMLDWVATRCPDVMALQEIRAPDSLVAGLLGDGWHVAHAESEATGRAGVAVASRRPLLDRRWGEDIAAFGSTGRWVEADIAAADGRILTVVSCYAHTGDETSPERMAQKLAFFEAITERITLLASDGRHVVLTGDLNVAHQDIDLKNWKGNRGCAGCLPEERAFFDRWIADGWVDVVRDRSGDVPGPYSWWSFRGRAFDNDAGWRIDYQIASADLAAAVTDIAVDRAGSYDTRWSDHAPVVVTYAV
jgi:exodeoxyribonuclease III